MATSKFIIFIHRCVGVLGCLMVIGMTARFFYLHEYVWTWVYTALIVFVLYNLIKDSFRDTPNYGGYYSLVFCGLFPCWREYSTYKREKRMEKYAFVYNAERRRLRIPEIPKDWHIQYSGNKYEDWRPETKEATGHERKMIDCDSLYNIEAERDEYNFKGVHDSTRSISIDFRYARGKSKDSIFYTYNLKNTSIRISRQQADSIFEANHIRKDY